jgi:hypothetical protein
MATTAGALSLVSVSSTTASLSSAVATAGTAPYTYQWYRSTTTGFSPGPGNILTGKTSLTLNDSALIPNSIYYYKVVATDSSSPAVAGTSSQLAVTTLVASQSPNAFGQSQFLGMIDMKFDYNTMSAQIDVTAGAAVYRAGQAVKVVANTAGGVPKVIGVSADADVVLGFINFDIKSQSFVAGSMCELSMNGNVIWLYAGEAITQGLRVCLKADQPGTVWATGHTANLVGWALDGAAAAGELIRVFLLTPSFASV